MELRISEGDLSSLRSRLLGANVESCAVILASEFTAKEGRRRLLAREIDFPTEDEYTVRGPLEAKLTPKFVAEVTKRARTDNMTLVWVHSHGGNNPPQFSTIDDGGEQDLAGFLRHRNPLLSHSALVLSEGGLSARELGSTQPVRVVSIGRDRRVLFPQVVPVKAEPEFDRQVRAFGSLAQLELGALRVGIVGLGGTGSIIAQQLVHLGVRDFTFVDADVVEESNLNRVSGSTSRDIGHFKVDIAARYARDFSSQSAIRTVRGDVTRTSVANQLLDCDFLFGCTDSHGSRAVIQQISYQYLISCVDVGSTIVVRDGHVTHVSGRVQFLAPGYACFTCSGLLDANEIRMDMMTAFERSADPYIDGVHEPAPAVMSINSTVASLGVSMMLSAVTGFPMSARHVLYDGLRPSLRSVRVEPDPKCYVCSESGSLARGDAWPLFTRSDDANPSN